MPFDPNQPFEVFDENQPFESLDDKGGFDPTKSFTPIDTDSPSQLGVAARAAGQGLAFGFGDEVVAAAKAPFSDKSYTELRDENRAALERDREAYPKTAIASEITGAVLPSVAATLLSGPVGGGASVANAGRLASVAKSVFNPATVKGMMGAGAAYGLGSSEADLTEGEVGEAAVDAGKSALFAGGLGKALPVVGKYGGELLEGTGKKLGEGAEFLASKAVGLTKGLRKRLDLTPADARAVGREGLESGIVSPFAGAETMAARQGEILKQTGDEIKAIIKEASETGAAPDIQKIIQKLEDKATRYGDSEVGKAVFNQYQSVISDLKAMMGSPTTIPAPKEMGVNMLGASAKSAVPEVIPPTPPNIQDLQTYKGVLGEAAYPKGVATEAKTGLQGAYTPIKEELEASVEGATSPQQAQVYKYLKDKFGKLETMGKGLTERLTSEEGNRFIRPTDFLVGGAFGLGGGIIPGIASVAAKRGIEKYGHQVGAVTMDKVSKILQRTPEVLGQYAPILQQAIQRGGTSFATQNFLLQERDPEYRKKMEELSNMPEGEDDGSEYTAPN